MHLSKYDISENPYIIIIQIKNNNVTTDNGNKKKRIR